MTVDIVLDRHTQSSHSAWSRTLSKSRRCGEHRELIERGGDSLINRNRSKKNDKQTGRQTGEHREREREGERD